MTALSEEIRSIELEEILRDPTYCRLGHDPRAV